MRISVADTGVGIAPEDLPYIWDRYYKVDKVHKRAVVGTGLGLSIVKGILESHGAAYGVDSTPGIGSTFWFELDAAAGYTDAEFESLNTVLASGIRFFISWQCACIGDITSARYSRQAGKRF